jgi:hypothetical protein
VDGRLIRTSTFFKRRFRTADTDPVAKGKPVARRGRKARDLPQTARPPTFTIFGRHGRRPDTEVTQCQSSSIPARAVLAFLRCSASQ